MSIIDANTTSPSAYMPRPPDEFVNTTIFTPSHQNWFTASLNNFLWAIQGHSTVRDTLDGLFPIIAQQSNVPLSDLLGPQNRDRLIAATSRVYSRWAAQLINTNMRSTSIPAGTELPQYDAEVSTPRRRLVQNRKPKIVLQAVLGFMVLCGVVAWMGARTKKVLRHNPCSVAGRMALLGKSEFVHGERTVMVEGGGKEGLFEGWMFSLGWWGSGSEYKGYGGEGERWYGIDVGRAEK